mgnify:FL=1
MNIYLLATVPADAVACLADRHVMQTFDTARTVLDTATVLRRYTAARELSLTKPSLKGAAHPRHPITRALARSNDYAAWVGAYARAAIDEVNYRGLRPGSAALGAEWWIANARDTISELLIDLTREREACPVLGRRIPGSMEFCDFPQRLDGAEDMQVAGDPVAGYRTWYKTTKVQGAPRAWAGASLVWSRRAPVWLSAECEVEELQWPGFGPKPKHQQYTARWVVPAALDTTSQIG